MKDNTQAPKGPRSFAIDPAILKRVRHRVLLQNAVDNGVRTQQEFIEAAVLAKLAAEPEPVVSIPSKAA